ncbi:MAG: hypothetical protein D6738_11675, partial [Acidobacteria bacterium]
LERRQFHALRAAGRGAHAIPPRAGHGTRDRRWSLLDAARFAVLASLAPPSRRATCQLPVSRRREVFAALEDSVLAEAARGSPWWLVVPLDGTGRAGSPRVEPGRRPLVAAPSAMVVDVTAVIGRVLVALQLDAREPPGE